MKNLILGGAMFGLLALAPETAKADNLWDVRTLWVTLYPENSVSVHGYAELRSWESGAWKYRWVYFPKGNGWGVTPVSEHRLQIAVSLLLEATRFSDADVQNSTASAWLTQLTPVVNGPLLFTDNSFVGIIVQ